MSGTLTTQLNIVTAILFDFGPTSSRGMRKVRIGARTRNQTCRRSADLETIFSFTEGPLQISPRVAYFQFLQRVHIARNADALQ